MKRAAFGFYVLLMLGMSSAYFMVNPTANSKLVLYNGVGLLSVLGMITGIVVHKVRHRTPWILFTLGLTSFLTADLIYYLLETRTGTVPFPSIADAFYLAMYPLVVAGLAVKIRKNSTGTKDWAGLIDAGIFGIALFSVLWVLVMDSYVPIAGQATTERLISLLYPVMDLAVLFMAIRLAVVVHRRHRSLTLIILALCSLVVADVQYGVLNAADAFQTGGVVDAFWLGFYMLFALGSLHPSMAAEFRPNTNQMERISNTRLILMFCATLTVPLLTFSGARRRIVLLR
jgi:hypothetical protein